MSARPEYSLSNSLIHGLPLPLQLYIYISISLLMYLIQPIFHPMCVFVFVFVFAFVFVFDQTCIPSQVYMEVVGLAGIDLVQPLLLKQMSKFVTFEALCAYTYYIYLPAIIRRSTQ